MDDFLIGNGTTGHLQMICGRSHEVIWEHFANVFANIFSDIQGIGDFNGDGVPDIALPNPTGWTTVYNQGLVRILSGATGERILTLYGTIPEERMGRRVAAAGDVDGDGYDDILVASHRALVRIFGGPDGRLIREHASEFTNTTRPSVAGVGDVNGDGHADYVIGWPQDYTVATFAGKVTLYSGRDGSEILSVYGEVGWGGGYAGDHLGRSVTAMGDVDGDGIPDFAAGAPGEIELHFGLGPGYVRIYSGADGSILLHLEPEANSTGNTSFGNEVGGGVDLSGDGVPDLLVAQPAEKLPGLPPGIHGALNVHCARTGVRLWKIYGQPIGSQRFGDRFALLQDVTGDGIGDFLAANPAYLDDAGEQTGKVWLYAGAPGSADRFCPASPNSTGQAASIGVVGPISVGNDELRLTLGGAVPGQAALFFLGAAEQPPQPFGEGTLCIAPPLLRLAPAAVEQDGTLEQPFPFSTGHGAAIRSGSTWHFQTWYRDPATPTTFDLSDALRILFTP